MNEKLNTGSQFPNMTVNLTGGGVINLPGDMDGKYNVVLFYRGHWWPYCRRQLVGFENEINTFKELDIKIFAASVDPEDKAQEVANDVSFPVGFGAGEEHRDLLGSWWEDRRGLIQPSEFIIDNSGKVITSSYSSGPIGRFEAQDVIKMANFLESKK
jgi:peroxiredoxin